ncbi:NAD(P)-dependent oxidoreductase [Agreia sp. COWG]|uniref:NAD-dependent epimerase/dehydratase family protein n=1 Tax=Agreia sp. COWG TaxID=2773266 RepID=UPI001928AB63|nr:NAD-dependent epimerase/dehydratase family protein [Agreia sp. COWG]CAD5989330.1 NAD-dependent dehydratase [Agreia sp. COWG]
MPNLLVTGGAGFIGSEIVRQALDAGYAVRILDSLRADVHGSPPELDPRAEFVLGDVRDDETVTHALRGIDAVCHQAGKVGLGVDFFDAPDYVSSNELGTAVLLAAMTRAGIDRMVFASSMVVYGEGSYRNGAGEFVRPPARRVEDLEAGRFEPLDPATHTDLIPELITEDAPVDPRNVYASSKLGQEYLATSWARSANGRSIGLRYHNVYGPGMPQNTPYAGVASLFRSALARGEAPRVFEDGAQRRDFVHVRDVASANLAALAALDIEADAASAPEGSFRAYNVGSGIVHTIGEMAAEISRASSGAPPVVTGEFRLGDVRHITASSERIATELGWRAATHFADGMAEFASAPLRSAVS